MVKRNRQRNRGHRNRKTVSAPVSGQVPQSSAAMKRLETATVLYLALPVFIFLAGFFRIGWGVAACLCLAFAIYRYLQEDRGVVFATGVDGMTRWKTAACLLAAAFVVLLYFEGIGPFGAWSWDARKHFMVLSHLSLDTWPPLFDVKGERFHLAYYTGYYLPAALVGKVFGWDFAYDAVVVWTLLGVFLALLWCFALSRKAALWIIAVFFLFSGMDVLRVAVYGGGTWWWEGAAESICPSLFQAIIFNTEYYAKGCFPFFFTFEEGHGPQLLANLVNLVYTPQHALSTWLCGGLLMHSFARGALLQRGGLIVLLALLWSSFNAVGAALLVVFCAVYSLLAQSGRPLGERVRTLVPAFSGINLASVLPLLLVSAYLLSSAFVELELYLYELWRIPGFLLFEFLILWSALYAFHRHTMREGKAGWLTEDIRPLFFYALLAVVIFIPMEPDFQKGASHLALFILMIAFIRALEHSSRMRIGKALRHSIIAIAAVGSITALSWLTSAVHYVYNEHFAETPRYTVHHDNTRLRRQPQNIYFNSKAYQFKHADNAPVHIAQVPRHWNYLGSPDSLYYRYFAPRRGI